jgi:RNA polymerase sigma factor (sigma-70 family)
MTHDEKERLFLSVLPFIRRQTWRMCRRTGMSFEDMTQEACIAVWNSLDTYNPNAGTLTTYTDRPIYWRLRGLFLQAINPIRKPQGHCPGSLRRDVPDCRRKHSALEFEETLSFCRDGDREIIREIYDDQARLVFDQLLFYDWSHHDARYQLRAWRMVKNAHQLPRLNHATGRYECRWMDGDVERVVTAPVIRNTATQFDPQDLIEQVGETTWQNN